ncbi:hypothetical protein [Mycoplasmopsis columbina]|uniref:hypothetical protein n=1 Tax=Mycoplasmopsis columbina TaxID=114881 RepID=UPI0004A7002C|nr:hypothetical protein [Mycoplasmopsis columbina]VEU77139.1 Uncharacterised protein [Mycoplasmopsis columbina]
MINNQNIKNAYLKLFEIARNNYISLTLSYDTVKKIKNSKNFFLKDFRFCIFWKDYYLLKQKHPELFIDNDSANYFEMSPCFIFNNERIFLDLIIETNEEKINKFLNKKNLKRFFYSFVRKKSLIDYFKYFGYSKLSLDELIKNLRVEKYKCFITQGKTLSNYYIFDNLNLNFLNSVVIDDYEYFYFSTFNEQKPKRIK